MTTQVQVKGAVNSMEVDATPSAGRVILYASDGTVLAYADKAQVSSTQPGVLLAARDYKTVRSLRTDEAGTLRTSDETVLLFDNSEGTSVNTTKWIQTTTTMTIAQAAATGIQLNSGSSVAATVGAMHFSHKVMPLWAGESLLARFCVRATAHSNNNLMEIGFGDPVAATTATATNGVCVRKNASGDWLPVITANGSETLGSVFANAATFATAIPATEYFFITIELRRNVVRFCIFNKTSDLVYSQDMDLTAISSGTQPGFSAVGLRAMYRTYNNASGATPAVQLFVKEASVTLLDAASQRDWNLALAGMGDTSLMNPVTSVQAANYTNNTTVTSRTLSNTAAGETTLGGVIAATAMATATTDLIMFGWQNPSAVKTFYVESIYIPVPLNQVVAVATTATVFQYFAAWNSSAVSLATAAPYPPRFIGLPGVHTAAVGLAANTLFSGNPIQVTFPTPIPVFPSRFFHIGCRCLVGTATATELYLWAGVTVTGFYE